MPQFGRRLATAMLWSAGLAACMGCGPPGASVSGQVTLDGAPLDDATISFVPQAEGQRQAGWATIAGGQYSIPAESGLGTGHFRVEIRALRATGEKTNDPTMIASREVVHARYNSQSELTAEIKPGPNVANFAVKSK